MVKHLNLRDVSYVNAFVFSLRVALQMSAEPYVTDIRLIVFTVEYSNVC